MAWIEPKTNWTATDRFNQVDYNRIKNNLNYLYDVCRSIFGRFPFDNMGEDHTDKKKRWDVRIFNLFETNLESIASHSVRINYGETKTYYANGVFIRYDELNRMESAMLDIYERTKDIEVPVKRLPFRLGGEYFPVKR